MPLKMPQNTSLRRAACAALLIPLLMTMSGCNEWPYEEAPPASGDAICEGTLEARAEHAAGLLIDGGPISKSTGRILLERITRGCNETV